jgi:chromate reductase
VGKPAAVIGATTGKVGTAVAQSQLRSILLVLDLAVMGQPEAYIQLTPESIAADHKVTDETMRKFLQRFLDSFRDWIEKVTGIVPEPGQPGEEETAAPALVPAK